MIGKRFADVENEEGPSTKRPKVQDVVPATDIWSARDLTSLLSFSQDHVQQLRNGILSFKGFLELILYSRDEPNRPAKINILNDYLDSHKTRVDRDKDAVFLPDLMQAWDYAAQTHNDFLASSVSSILALLLKALAILPESRDYGILLCRTLLKPALLKLISRSVAAPKNKEHVISPCLRLLTEIVSFDGGFMAKQTYAKREATFETKILARNLGLFKSEADRRKPSIRSNAIRYLLANFKYQDEGAKIDILKHGHITKALFDNLKEDTPEVLQDVFKVIETHVLRDEAIPRASKSWTLSERSLSGVVAALRMQANIEPDPNAMHVDGTPAPINGKEVTLAFLKLVCTTPSLGILRASGWYPPGSEKHTREGAEEVEAELPLDLGLDSISWYGRYQTNVPVRNTILATFLQSLRPYSSTEERDLLLSTFAAGPELVADYFFSKRDKFPFDPKLTNTWIGYASFLFSAVQLPVPSFFGAQDGYAGCPPPISITIENIVPQPLTQKVLTRCLNQPSDLVRLFSIRILVVALQKLQKVLKHFDAAASEGNGLWKEASTRLVSEFTQRCPPMKDVVATFRKTADDNILQKEAISRLVRLYYEVTPQFAMEEKFDVSTTLAAALSRIEIMSTQDEQYAFRLLEVQHLIVIAQCSIGMRWWHKQGSLQFSPFTTLLRLCARMTRSADQSNNTRFIKLLQSVIEEYDVLQQQTSTAPVKALVASLVGHENWEPTEATWNFLDECLGRLIRKPVKYLDDLENLDNKSGLPTSLLVMACVEQLPFTEKLPSQKQASVKHWFALFLAMLAVIGEQTPEGPVEVANTVTKAQIQDMLSKIPSPQADDQNTVAATETTKTKSTRREIVFTDPPSEKRNHTEMSQWQQKSVEDALESGDVSDIIFCLSSRDASTRLQAQAALQKLMGMVKESTYEEKDHLYVLLGEIVETAKSPLLPQPISQLPLPYVGTGFATHALSVIRDPSHLMYPKLNKYLNKGPSWQISKIASYWLDKTILEVPDEDDKHWDEVAWTIDFLLDGTRTFEDVQILLGRNSLEKILNLFASPTCPKSVRELVLQLVYRIASAGGATSLITRTGILAWLDMREALGDVEKASLQVLKTKVSGGLNEERVGAWSKGALSSSAAPGSAL